ncbi:hypothetical protein DSL72_009305 [Monilinia vaccinii-corymbosi]|uniref:Uncharacterized protein n=1 Tax=Monilinia vaccinii-corymbosi TaxID=61207 RepID=A0A8A3PQT6_9HELO|nr:hypothetical protein DSL72_009305 [Monilinia vaccinii-corymbosi]
MDKEAASTDFARVGWLFSKVAWLDPEPVHVFTGFNIYHIARLHGQQEPPISTKRKVEGMRVINKRLNDPAEALPGGNIGAVANFTSHEVGHHGLALMWEALSPFRGIDLCRLWLKVSTYAEPTYELAGHDIRTTMKV